jgi:VCBS repeat-containing protein
MTVQQNGKVIVSGRTGLPYHDVALARFHADGTLDNTFNRSGTSTLGGTVGYSEGGTAVVLDNNAIVVDDDLSLSNNYANSTLTIQRNTGANAEDTFSSTGTLSLAAGNVSISGTVVGTYTNAAGQLAITFNSSATNQLVNRTLQQITYSNTNEAPPSSVVLEWTFNDGNTGAQGTGGALSATASITVTITAVNDAPVLDNTGLMTLTSITEDQTNNAGQTVASIISSAGGDRITDVDSSAFEGIAITALQSGNGTWQYSLDNGTNWSNIGSVTNTSALLLRSTDHIRFVPNGQNGTAADITFRAWDQTSGSAGNLVDTSTNGGTTSFSSATEIASISVTSVADSPQTSSDSANAIEAGGLNNGTVGSDATGNVLSNDGDVDSGDSISVVGVAFGTFSSVSGSVNTAIQGTYGILTLQANGSFVYVVDNSNAAVQALRTLSNTLTETFTYTIEDSTSLSSTTQLQIVIQGTNDTPTDIIGGPFTIAENSVNTTVVGTLSASDLEAGDTLTFSLSNNAGGRFAIDGNTGDITVQDSSLLNFESSSSHVVVVRITDTAGLYREESVTISLTDVDEFDVGTVSDTNASGNSVDENSSIGTLVQVTAFAVDGDGTNNTITYSLTNNDGGRFAIDSVTGVVTVAGAIDREADGASRTITVRATSSDGSFTDQNFTIAINDLDEFNVGAVTDSNATSNNVDENASAGTVVQITALAADADATNNTITYSLQNNDGGRFAIDWHRDRGWCHRPRSRRCFTKHHRSSHLVRRLLQRPSLLHCHQRRR